MPVPQPPSQPASAPSVDERTLATAALVLEITTAAAGERELDAILHAALDRLHAVVSFTGGSIALVDGDDLVIRAATGPFQEEALGQRLARGPSRSWTVVETLGSVRVDDVGAAGLRMTGPKASTAVRSWLAVPIERRGIGIGLLEVDSTTPGAFSEADQVWSPRSVGRWRGPWISPRATPRSSAPRNAATPSPGSSATNCGRRSPRSTG